MVFQKLVDLAKKYECTGVASVVLDDERFLVWSASCKPEQHHYGKGGLARHTLEVCELSLNSADYYFTNGIFGKDDWVEDKFHFCRQLYLACLFHDCGKMWDYTHSADYSMWTGNTHKRRIHHITRSALVWHEAVRNVHWSDDTKDTVLHAILAHHGKREWGSPVAPHTRIAWLLHLNDSISARMTDVDKFDRK